MKKKDLENMVKLYLRGEELALSAADVIPMNTTNGEVIFMCCYILSLVKDKCEADRTMSSFMQTIQNRIEICSIMRKKLAEFRELEHNKTE